MLRGAQDGARARCPIFGRRWRYPADEIPGPCTRCGHKETPEDKAMTGWDDPWFAEKIEQTRASFGDGTSPDAVAIGTSIMVAGCVIAQAIDAASRVAEMLADRDRAE